VGDGTQINITDLFDDAPRATPHLSITEMFSEDS
jgi:hypothetical protein